MGKQRAALTAVVGGVAIFCIKMISYFMSESVALLSDALESIVNIAASLLMAFSVYVSAKPADEDHHYGHQRIENISSMIEGLLIIMAAFFIVHEAVGRIYNPVPLVGIEPALGISLFATAMNGVLSWYLGRTAGESGSLALEADARHLLSDVFSSVGVVAGLWIAGRTGWVMMDPAIALAVSALIARMGVGLILKSSKGLMDHHSPEVEAEIMAVLERHSSRYIDFHDVKTRRGGGEVFAELHLAVDGSLTVQEAHDFTDHLEADLREELPEVTITIHVEPPEEKEGQTVSS